MSRVGLVLAWCALATLVASDTRRVGGTVVLLLVSAILVALGERSGEPRAATAGVGVLVGAYALTLVGRVGIDGRAPLVAALVVTLILLGSWALDPGIRSSTEPRQTRAMRALVAGGTAAATMGATALLALGVTTFQFTGWLTILVAAAAGGGTLVLLARQVET